MKQLGKHLHGTFVKILDDLIGKIPDVISAVVLLLVFVVTALLIRRTLRTALRRVHMDSTVAALITRLTYYLLLAIGMIEALSQLNVNLATLGIGVGAFGFAVGFALRDILSNFLSGILILWTRHFTTGDQIRIKEYEGTVEAIEMRGTILRTYDGRRVTIPNSEVYTNAVTNNTIYTLRRSSVFVGVGYGTDLVKAESAIRAALKNVPDVAEEPTPDVLVKDLGGYSIQLEVRIWTPAQQIEMLTVNSEATKAIREALQTAGLSLPFPTQVIILQEPEPKP